MVLGFSVWELLVLRCVEVRAKTRMKDGKTTARFKIKEIVYVGGCQNYGPFLAPYYNTAPNI